MNDTLFTLAPPQMLTLTCGAELLQWHFLACHGLMGFGWPRRCCVLGSAVADGCLCFWQNDSDGLLQRSQYRVQQHE